MGDSPLRMDHFWFHGTPRKFEAWAAPPVVSARDPYLMPHSFLSLSANLEYARLHAGPHGHVCRVSVSDAARILDLREKSEGSFRLWRHIRTSRLGRQHAALRTYESWHRACQRGWVLRYFVDGQTPQPFAAEGWQALANAASTPPALRAEAQWHLEDFARTWIEGVIGPAAQMGFDAVICPELEAQVDRVKPSLQLFAYSADLLSEPLWMTAA